MFPSIAAGGSGVTKAVGIQTATSYKTLKKTGAEDSISRRDLSSPAPTLPLISREGSFTSLVSSRSTKSNWRDQRKAFKASKVKKYAIDNSAQVRETRI